jgi:type IV secretory pathway TraG/TraD family ATPase VirD4
MLQYAKDTAENFRPRPGRCGLIWGGLQTKRGLEPLRWGENIGVEVTGKQGSGKSRGFVMPSLLIEDVHEDAARWTTEQRRFHPYGYETVKIVLDIKGSLTGASAGYHASLGQNVYIIDPYSDDPGVSAYNPFDQIRIFTKYMFSDCVRLANWVCEAVSTENDSSAGKYFEATAVEAIGAVIAHNAFRSLAEGDPALNSPVGLIMFMSGFDRIEDAINAVLEYEHDPHSLAGWIEEVDGARTGRPTKTCPWIAQSLRVLGAKARDEVSGIFGSALKDLPIYRDERIVRNVTRSTFRIEDVVNDPERSSIIYIRMTYADLEQLRSYVRLLINDLLYRLMPPAAVIDGREARGNLREFLILLEECASLQRMNQIQKAAAILRGLGGKLVCVWQNRNQLEATYGKLETISANQGLHLYYTPETKEESERLSEMLGETSIVVQHRNVSGDRMTIAPRNQLAEQNAIETARHYSPSEVRALPNDELFFFAKGLQGRVKQYWYDKNPELQRRSKLPPPKECPVTATRPYCMINLERELGPERYKIAISPAPDPFKKNREAAIVLPNGCRVHRWDRTFADTGKKLFYAQVWLPDCSKPILNVRKGHETVAMREEEVTKTLAEFDGRDGGELELQLTLAVVDSTDDLSAVPTFDPALFT